MNKRKYSLLLFVIIFTVFTVFWVYNLVSKKQLVCWDEGNSIYIGNTISQAIRQKNLNKFWQLTRTQYHYPFVQSWYLGLATLPFEYTIESARLVGLLLLFPTVVFIWLLAKKISSKSAPAALSSLLLLTSPNLLLLYSMALREALGAALTLLTFLIYVVAREKRKNYLFACAGFSALSVALTKYNFGVLVIGALGLESVLWLITEKKLLEKKYWLNNLSLYLPLLLGTIWWLFLPLGENRFAQISPALLQFLAPQVKDVFNLYDTNLLGHLLFYPLELALSYTVSWPIFLLVLIGFFFSIKYWKDYRIRILSVFFLFNFLSATKNMMNNQGRYIAICVPFFFLVGSWGLIKLIHEIKKRKISSLARGFSIPLSIIFLFISIKDIVLLPRSIPAVAAHEILSPVFYQQDYKAGGQYITSFEFNRQNWPKVLPQPDSQKIPDVMDFVIQNIDLNKDVFFAGYLNELSPGLTSFYLDKAREKEINNIPGDFQYYIVAVVVRNGSIFDTYDYRVFTKLNSFYAALSVLSDPSLTKINEKEFQDLGLIITVLGKASTL